MNKLSFSGHESFICKQFWLKKGFDFISEGKTFHDDDAVVDLGVGKNMVGSIHHWLKSFDIVDEKDQLNEVANFLFGKNGRDTFIEDLGTIWLLHYHLVTRNRASIYNLVFNLFRKERFDFTKAQLHNFIKRQCKEQNANYNENTVHSDINVFLKNYMKPKNEKVNIEDEFVGLLQDLDLIKKFKLDNTDGKLTEWFRIDNEHRDTLPPEIVLYSILNMDFSNSVSFKELQVGFNSPGLIFALNAEGLYKILEVITQRYPEVTFTESAGNQVLQFKSKPNNFEVLDDYYKK